MAIIKSNGQLLVQALAQPFLRSMSTPEWTERRGVLRICNYPRVTNVDVVSVVFADHSTMEKNGRFHAHGQRAFEVRRRHSNPLRSTVGGDKLSFFVLAPFGQIDGSKRKKGVSNTMAHRQSFFEKETKEETPGIRRGIVEGGGICYVY